MIVADTGAILALLDRADRYHDTVRDAYEENPGAWILPWAILPEVDYLVSTQLGLRAQDLFLSDLDAGAFTVEWGRETDLTAASRLCGRYPDLGLGLVDAVVISTAERLNASAIATLDLRHFGAVKIEGSPKLLPRDL